MNNNWNKWESSNSDCEGSWNGIPLLKTHEELEVFLYGHPNTTHPYTTSGGIEEEVTSTSFDNTMGTDMYSKVSSDAKSKTEGAPKKGKHAGDIHPGFNNTKPAQHLPKEQAFAAASVSNVDPDGGLPRATDLMLSISLSNEAFKSKVLNKARAAMDELFLKATAGDSLWIINDDGIENFNEIEYQKEFQSDDLSFENLAKLFGTSEQESHGANVEASREFGCIPMLRADIVNMLMNCELWAANFCNIVSRATMFGVISPGGENHDETLLMLTAEFRTASPLIPTRECYLARYCRQLDQYTWGVVDISVENLFPSCPATKFHRKPSGCLVMEVPGGIFSNVAWVEHCLADDCTIHNDFKHIVDSGIGFGARYWHSALSRYANWSSAVSSGMPNYYGVCIPPEGRVSVLRLGERLLRSFFVDMSSSKYGMWMPSTSIDDVKGIKVRRNRYNGVVGLPNGDSIAFATSFKVLVPPRRVFNFLSNEDNRAKWDILSYEQNTRTLIRIPTGPCSDQNYISILEVFGPENCNATHYLQNAYKDHAGAYVVYAPIDGPALQYLLTGADPDIVVTLPSGFAILPDTVTPFSRESDGCLVTVGFHIMDTPASGITNNTSTDNESVEVVQKIVEKTFESITTAAYSNPP